MILARDLRVFSSLQKEPKEHTEQKNKIMSTLSQEKLQYIEEVGIFLESLGMTRMAGRILGYLMVSEKELVSFDEITETLQASKSAISTNLKSLQQILFIKAVGVPGDRKTFYALADSMAWDAMLEKRFRVLELFADQFDKGLNLRQNKQDRTARWIREANHFFRWLGEIMPGIIKQWPEAKKTFHTGGVADPDEKTTNYYSL